MALAGFVTAGVLPAAAAPSTVQYVALGDSYAAGTASQLGGCPHGPDNYPELLDGSEESRIDLTAFAACSGWTTSDLLDVLDDDGQPSPLSSHTRLVTGRAEHAVDLAHPDDDRDRDKQLGPGRAGPDDQQHQRGQHQRAEDTCQHQA